MAHRRLFWNIVDKIESRIAAGEYVPGSRLPPERVLANNLMLAARLSVKRLLH